jgi:Tol biopolymer transport system component
MRLRPWMHRGSFFVASLLAAVVLLACGPTPGPEDLSGQTGTAAPPPSSTPIRCSGRIAFVSGRERNWEIYVADMRLALEGALDRGLTNLTNHPGQDTVPIWSPDGTRIAFLSDRDDGRAARSSREVAVIDTGRLLTTAEPEKPRDVFVMRADGSDVVNLTNHPGWDVSPAWSPDGTRIAFVSDRDGNRDIWVVNLDGSGLRNLTAHPARDGGPSWSPDGARIAFESDRAGNPEIYVMDVQDALQDVLSHEPVNVTDNPADDLWPSWSPAGDQIAFVSQRDGNREIYVVNADGSGLTNLTDHPDAEWRPYWSPDGRRIAFVSWRDDNPEIYALTDDGSVLSRLTDNDTGDWGPSWSPDGTCIAFYSLLDDNWEVMVMDIRDVFQGTGAPSFIRLTSNRVNDNAPTWAPK